MSDVNDEEVSASGHPDQVDQYDQVDQIVQQWSAARPDLDLDPLEVFGRIARLAKRLERIRQLAFTSHGLAGWEFDVLAALRRSAPQMAQAGGQQLSPGALVVETQVTSGTMTNRIDRLADRGLVNRTRDPRDGRGVVVELTAKGQEAVDGAFADLLAAEQRLLATMSNQQTKELATQLRELSLELSADEQDSTR